MTAKPSLAKFFVPCTDQLPRGMERIDIEFADYHIANTVEFVDALSVTNGWRSKVEYADALVDCAEGLFYNGRPVISPAFSPFVFQANGLLGIMKRAACATAMRTTLWAATHSAEPHSGRRDMRPYT